MERKRRRADDDGDSGEGERRGRGRKRRARGGGGGRRKSRRGGSSGGGGLGNVVRRGAYWLLIIGIWSTVALGGVVAYYGARLPSITSWAVPARPPNIKVLANDGRLIANRGDTGGETVTLDELPAYLPEAVVAIEDRRFYSHFGVDPKGLARAIYSNFRAGGVVQGGSTLTQQLAKNLFLTPARTMERKVQEVILALWLEARYSKKEILEMYLNRVYLGSGAYGVDAAARRYFGKPARSVTLSEAAVIAAVLKAPSRYSPLADAAASDARANLVLQQMREQGYITEREAKLATDAEHAAVKPVAGNSGSYAADWVADLMPDLVGALSGDVIVDTTIDLDLQAQAATAVEEGLAKDGKEFRAGQGVLIAIDGTGAVRALVGGRDYEKSQFNRAVEARRQPGSAFKPFVYLTALEIGLRPESVTVDEPIQIGNWRPQNYGKTYRGAVTLQTALALSINTVSARLTQLVGADAVVATAHRLGIASDLKAIPSIALGTSEVTPLELTAAYVPFANGGYAAIPHVVKRITSVDGKVLYERTGTGSGVVVAPANVGMMNAMLRETLLHGTGTKASLPGWDAAGKTGTSQDYRDAWFIGYTANLTTGVWFGNDDNSPTRRTTGGSLPAQVWSKFMIAAHKGVPPADLPGNYQRQQGDFVAGVEPRPRRGLFGLFGNEPQPQEMRYGTPISPPEPTRYGTPPDSPGYAPSPDAQDVSRTTNNPSYEPNYQDQNSGDDPNYPADGGTYADGDPNYAPQQDADPNYQPDDSMMPPADVGNYPRPPADVGSSDDYPPPRHGRRNLLDRLFGG